MNDSRSAIVRDGGSHAGAVRERVLTVFSG